MHTVPNNNTNWVENHKYLNVSVIRDSDKRILECWIDIVRLSDADGMFWGI